MQNTELKVRKLNFEMEMKVKPHWFDDNLFSTQLMNSYHVLFPVGEKFFIRSVKTGSAKAVDERLRTNAKRFIGQELQHGQQHTQFHSVMEEQGLSAHSFARFIFRVWTWLDKVTARLFGSAFPLAVTAAMEHFTALFAEATFDEKLMENCPPHLRDMLKWHAAEEVEHKAVAFDLLKPNGIGYFRRVLGFFIGGAMLFGFAAVGFCLFILQDKGQVSLRRPAAFFRQLWQFIDSWGDCVIRQIKQVPQYFKPGFHPDQIESPIAVEAFLNEDVKLYERVQEQAA